MKKIIFFCLLLIINSCNSQKNNNVTDTVMQYYNENIYKDWEIDNAYSPSLIDKYLKKENKRLKILDFDEQIKIEKSDITTPITNFFMYNKKNRVLILKGSLFYNVNIGVWRYYDEMGQIIKETNWDKPYKISVEDLVQVLKQELNIDLLDMTKKINVSRNTEPTPQYKITIPQHPSRVLRWIKVDAITGKILSDEIKTPPNKYTSEWRDNKNKKK